MFSAPPTARLHASIFAALAFTLATLPVAPAAHAQLPSPVVTAPVALPAASPAPPTAVQTPAPDGATLLTSQDVGAFFDGLIPEQLLRNDTAGAVVTVVKDGQVLLSRGYGFADYQARTPVSADTTLFRPGSISKLFMATAVMQQVEAGKLDLDRNVNDYLDFALPDTFPKPITLRALLTHTAGFEDNAANLFAADPTKPTSLADYIHATHPVRIFAPGTVTSYSNYGAALAGYVVERVSGEPFAQYVDGHVLAPLRMAHSSCFQPLPGNLVGAMSKGYTSAAEAPTPFEVIQGSPAGALSVTGADMARFMMAYLAEGSLEGAQILRPESVREMWRRQFAPDPRLNGMGLSFYQESEAGGPEVFGHGGDTIVFHSEIAFLPAEKVGLFVSYNSAGEHPGRGRSEMRRAFLARYFPSAVPPLATVDPAEAHRDAAAVAGNYQTTRRTETNFLKLATLFDQSTVEAQADGSLTISGLNDLRGHAIHWQPAGSLLYRETDGRGLVAFERDPRGQVDTLAYSFPGQEATRAPWFENQKFALPVIGGGLGCLLLTALLWPVAALARRYYGRPLFPAPGGARTLFVLSRWVCVLDVGVIVGWLVLLSLVGNNVGWLGDMHTPAILTLYILGSVGALGTLVLLASAVSLTRQRATVRRWPRVLQWLLAISGGVYVWFTWHWHLLGW